MDEAHSHDVLVVDDDTNSRQTISIALERKGLRVMVAEDGVEAMRVLEVRRFCVMLLDLVLPKADGYAVIAYVKENLVTVVSRGPWSAVRAGISFAHAAGRRDHR